MKARVDVGDKDVLLMSLTGLVSQNSQEDVVVQGSGLSRGDKRRNAKLARLRELVPADNAILGIDLADEKQAIVLTDHDSQVLARTRVKAKAWRLGPVLEWGREQARQLGFADVTVGCEPTGHRWRVLDQLAARQNMVLVCVQPLLTGRARESEDYTRDKRDDKDAVLIARLVAQLDCYAPERTDETWARLRHLEARRDRLISESTACVQQLRDLLECAWPAVLAAAAKPFDSVNWCAALAVVLERCNGDPRRLARLGPKGFEAAMRRELPRWAWPTGVAAHRHRGVHRAHRSSRGPRATARRAGTRPLGAGRLAHLPSPPGRGRSPHGRGARRAGPDRIPHQHPGVSAIGAAAILAETGAPPASTAPVPWSNTPGCAHARTPAAPTPASRGSPGAAGPGYGWPPGAPCGARYPTTR